jgi:hypothetical protein
MPVVEQLKRAIASYPTTCREPEELARLGEFLQRMKDAGIARTREYDLPQPDTLGRAMYARHDNDRSVS